MSKSGSRSELLDRLGGKCAKCGNNDSRILHIDHIHGQGYLEKEYFIDKENMYLFYLKYFDEESKFLQVLCVNCNLTKRMDNKEGRGRPNLATLIGRYQQSLLDKDTWAIEHLCIEYPQFESIKNRLKTRLPLALELEKKRNDLTSQLSQLSQELPHGFLNHEAPRILQELKKSEQIKNKTVKFIKERESVNPEYTRTSGEIYDFMKKEFGFLYQEANAHIQKMIRDGFIVEVRDACFKTMK